MYRFYKNIFFPAAVIKFSATVELPRSLRMTSRKRQAISTLLEAFLKFFLFLGTLARLHLNNKIDEIYVIYILFCA